LNAMKRNKVGTATTMSRFARSTRPTIAASRQEKEATHFLPFNRVSHPGEIQCGAGNPQHPSGYRPGYFWEEVLAGDSFLDILGHFMFIRYHQLDAVRNSNSNSYMQ